MFKDNRDLLKRLKDSTPVEDYQSDEDDSKNKNRNCLSKKGYSKFAAKEDERDKLCQKYNIAKDTLEYALDYPNNLRFGHFIRFLCIPTCCYQHAYPTSPKINWCRVILHGTEFSFCQLLIAYLCSQHIHPIILEAMPGFQRQDFTEIAMSTLHLAVPTTYLWLVIFYSTFHAYLNFWGELTRFSDRRFYLDWWNAENLSVFWRKWNFPIHSFLFRHVYYPLRRR